MIIVNMIIDNGDDLISNLFGVNVATPHLANTYM